MDEIERTDSKAGEVAAQADLLQQTSELEQLRALYKPALALLGAVVLVRMGQIDVAAVIPVAVQKLSLVIAPLQARYGDEDKDMVAIFEEAGIKFIEVDLPNVETPAADD